MYKSKRFTDRAKEIMALANKEAQRYGHEYLNTGHILLAIVEVKKDSIAYVALRNLNLKIDLEKIRSEFDNRTKSGSDVTSTDKVRIQTPLAKKVIEYAVEQARSLNHNYVGPEHLLLGLFLTLSDGTELVTEEKNIAKNILLSCGITFENVRKEILELIGAPSPLKPLPEAIAEDAAKFAKQGFSEAQKPVKCEFFEKQEFIIQETGAQEIRKTTPRGSMSDEKVKEAIAKFLSDKEFVQATECSVKPFRNLKTPLIITKVTIFYKDRE